MSQDPAAPAAPPDVPPMPPDAAPPGYGAAGEQGDEGWASFIQDPRLLSLLQDPRLLRLVQGLFAKFTSRREAAGAPAAAAPPPYQIAPEWGSGGSSDEAWSTLAVLLGAGVLTGVVLGLVTRKQRPSPLLRRSIPVGLGYMPEMNALVLYDERGQIIGGVPLEGPALADISARLYDHAYKRRAADRGWATTNVPIIRFGAPSPAANGAVPHPHGPHPHATGPAAGPPRPPHHDS